MDLLFHTGFSPKHFTRWEEFMNYYIDVLKNYALFTGRARRKEFWMFVLVNVIIGFVIGLVAGLIKFPMLGAIYNLAVLVPSIAVGARRMHDTDHSGWWQIVPFVNLYFACIDGTPGENSYGPDPKGRAAVQGFEVVQK